MNRVADLLSIAPGAPDRVVKTALQGAIEDGHPDQGDDAAEPGACRTRGTSCWRDEAFYPYDLNCQMMYQQLWMIHSAPS